MHKFWSVTGQLVEVHQYIDVPMRWCERYSARERRQLWVSATTGQDVKLIVHSREKSARRGHQMTALLLSERLVGVYNASTGKQVNYVQTDPPLLWRRCDAAVVAALSIASIAAVALLAWPGLLVSVPLAFPSAPLLVAVRFAWRCRTRAQVDLALGIVKGREVEQPRLQRVK